MDEQARISAEILRNKFAAVIGDMRATLVNTSYSSAISESKECANALYTEAGSLVAVDNAVHLCSLAATGADVLDDFQFDLTGEDIIVTNDPYSGGTRIQDFTMIAPLVHEDDIVLYLGVRARMPDVGGELLGGFNAKAGEIWAEGARFTPVKLYRDGRLQKDVLTTILLNSREPDALRLDLDAMLAALRVGRRRMSDIIGRYGIDAVQAAMQWAIDYAGRRVDAQIARWPEGEYTGSSVLAHDCHGRRDLHVRATLRVRGGRVEIDLTESDPQSDRFVNCTAATSQAYALLPILAAMDESTPRNAGILDRVRVITRQGTIVAAEFPAPTAWSLHHVGAEVADAVASALATCLPEKAGNVAANLMLANTLERVVRHGGTIEQLGSRNLALLCQGGCGGAQGRDGWGMPGVFAETPLPSIELYEAGFPGTIARLEFATDSGGPGQWRGGLGTETVIELPKGPDQLCLTLCVEMRAREGFAGGRPGSRNDARLFVAGEERPVDGCLADVPLDGPAELRLTMGGGPGWGPAWERDPERVVRDVLDGYVSVEAAARDYGVIVDPAGLRMDPEATREARRRRRAPAPAAVEARTKR